MALRSAVSSLVCGLGIDLQLKCSDLTCMLFLQHSVGCGWVHVSFGIWLQEPDMSWPLDISALRGRRWLYILKLLGSLGEFLLLNARKQQSPRWTTDDATSLQLLWFSSQMVVSAGKIADLQRVGMLSRLGEQFLLFITYTHTHTIYILKNTHVISCMHAHIKW